MTIQLRPYQSDLISRVYQSYHAGNRNVLAVMPTGAGKSVVVSQIILDGHLQGLSECVIAHRNELVGQMSLHVARRGIPHRIIASKSAVGQITAEHRREFGRSFVNPNAPCSVVSVDTLIARQDQLQQWAAQVQRWTIDEAHHCIGNATVEPNKWGKAIAMFPNAYGLGVTATPLRADGKGLGAEYDGPFHDMLIGPTMRDLIDIGALCDYEIACPESDMVVDDGDFTANGDLSPKKGRLASQKSHIVGDVVVEYLRRSAGKRAICFATDVETSNEMAARFNDAGVRAASVSAKTPAATRNEYIRRFRDGQLDVLVNVDLFSEGFDCLDTETEILTPNGWKNHIDAASETHCYAWNPQTEEVEIVDILNHGVRDTKPNEKMWSVKSQHIDMRVTEGHRVYYRKQNYTRPDNMTPGVKVKTARELHTDQKAFVIPLSGEMTFPGVTLTDDEIRILGWFLTDGWMERGDVLCVAQSKVVGISKLFSILSRLGWEYTFRVREPSTHNYENSKPAIYFRIPRRNIVHMIDMFNKDMTSPRYHKMTREQFAILWESAMDGDGSRQRGKSGTLTCNRKTQVDVYQHMATVRGFATMHGHYRTKNGSDIYTLRVRDRKWHSLQPKDSRGATFELEESNCQVWCVQNRLGTLITRRNGRVVILGNCPAVETVIMARPTASLGVYLQQFGRALRPLQGKSHGLVIDHVSNWKRHGLPDRPRVWSLARRDKRSKRAPDPDDIPLTACRECSRPYERVYNACPYCGHQPVPAGGGRSIDMVDGDLMLLDRDKLAELRAAMTLEAPGDVAARVTHVAGELAGRGAANRAIERHAAQADLVEAIEQWAGVRRAMGESDSVIQRRFYHATGCDILTAMGGKRSEMDALANTVRSWYM